MTTAKKLSPIRLNGTDVELRKFLHERGLVVPLNEDDTLNREEAARMLVDWKQQYEKPDTGRNCKVIFHASTSPSSGPYVFASLNNMTYQIPYEQEVTIPEIVLRECIDRAKITEYRTLQDEYGRFTTTDRVVPVYPYTFLGYVEATEE